MTNWTVVILAVAAAGAYAVSTALKHVSAARVPDAQSLQPKQVASFVRATLLQPLWVGGIVFDLLGLTLQVFALHFGALAVVQPLLITGLLFALVLRRIFGGAALTRRQVAWSVVLVAALAGFLLLASVGAASSSDMGVDLLPAVVGGIVGATMAAVCIALGRRLRNGGQSAAVFGIAVGVLYAGAAALIKTVTDIATRRHLGVFTSWQLYALVVVGVVGLVLSQLAFQAGPLSASLPATATVDPLLSVVIGVAIFDEHLRRGPGGGAVLVILLLVIGGAAIELSRAPTATPTAHRQSRYRRSRLPAR